MSDLTLFAAPKPFAGDVALTQRNALRSWARLDPPVRILLFGDEPGIAAAAEIGAEHLPRVERNVYSTPLVDSLFRDAHRVVAGRGKLAYVNADIVLLDDFRPSVERVGLRRFLLAGRRRNLDVGAELAFEPGWQASLRRRARRTPLEAPWGSDYFVFPATGRSPPCRRSPSAARAGTTG